MVDQVELAGDAGKAPLARRLAAEFMGTLLLVAVGSGAATLFTLGPLRGFNNIVTAQEGGQGFDPVSEALFSNLLNNSLGDVLGIALAFGFILAVLVYAFGGVSGGHFNPAVTFALALSRRFSWADVAPYWLVQILGGIVGALVIGGIYGDAGVTFEGTDILLGATVLGEGVNTAQAILSEAFIAFVLVTAIMAVAIDPRAPKGWSGLIIGLSLAGGIMLTAQATGGSANFARTLGPMVASIMPMYDAGTVPWGDIWIYFVGPLVGASAAALLYKSVTGLELVAPAPGPGAATPATDTLVGPVEHVHEKGDVHDAGPDLGGRGSDEPNPGPTGPWKGTE